MDADTKLLYNLPGLISAGVIGSPFPHCDVVTTTTHKTLRGSRSGIIFFRRGLREVPGKDPVPYNIENDLNFAVFPALQVIMSGRTSNYKVDCFKTYDQITLFSDLLDHRLLI